MDASNFVDAATSEIAQIVARKGPRVCVLPINGTRRWFVLEQSPGSRTDDAEDLITSTGVELRRLIRLLFDHGIKTVVTPVYGRELADERGGDYRRMAVRGLRLLTEEAFQDFYAAEGVRVNFYGDYADHLADNPGLLNAFDHTRDKTQKHRNHRLFYGVCGESAVRTITQHAVEQGRVLSHEEAIRAFYGEDVPLADLFIGFDAPTAFDMPLLDKGGVDLYFTVAPSPYMDRVALRLILHDWLFIRRDEGEADYRQDCAEALASMRHHYRANAHTVVGLGRRHHGIWYYRDGTHSA